MKEAEIKNKLSPAQVSVMLHKVTEPPYFGRFWDHFEAGTYRCAACAVALFGSADKFDSKTGWPSFKKPLNEKDLQFKSEQGPDDKIEIRCKKCKSHLGYVIAGDTPYYRINSVCLSFEEFPVAESVVAAATTAATATPPVFPEPSSVITAPIEESSSWSLAPMLAGALIGIAIGVGATVYYLSPSSTPVTSDTATSTTEIASTTTQDSSTPETVVDTNASDAATAPQEPASAPEQSPDSAQTLDSGATSTQ